MISAGSVASLDGVLADSPGRFDGRFVDEGGYEAREELVLTGSSNLLIRSSGSAAHRLPALHRGAAHWISARAGARRPAHAASST